MIAVAILAILAILALRRATSVAKSVCFSIASFVGKDSLGRCKIAVFGTNKTVFCKFASNRWTKPLKSYIIYG